MRSFFKKIALFAGIGMLCAGAGHAQDKGIKFFEGSWDELLAMAKKTGKPVFIDVYTSWCGPCKMMAKEIFPLKQVGDKYNAAFINYQTDAEKGDGITIAQKYAVTSYPTYLYLKSDGEIVHRSGGYSPDPALFIDAADIAVKSAADPYTISRMTEEFEGGKRDTAFLRSYISKLTVLEMDNTKALDIYFSLLPDAIKNDTATLDFFVQQTGSATSATFSFIMKNLDGLYKGSASDQQAISMLSHQLSSVLSTSLTQSMEAGNYEQAFRLIGYADRIPGMDPFYQDLFGMQKLEYFDKTNKIKELIASADEYLKDIGDRSVKQIREENEKRFSAFMKPYIDGRQDSTKEESFDKMREYFKNEYSTSAARKYYIAAKHFYNKVTDKTALKKALGWSKKARLLFPEDELYKKLSEDLSAKIK